MKVVVDESRCCGHARCHDEAPSFFALDESGYCALTDPTIVPGDLEAEVRAGVAQCPENALTILP
jgi:ferredoxin